MLVQSPTVFRGLNPAALFRWITKQPLHASLSAEKYGTLFSSCRSSMGFTIRLRGARSGHLGQRPSVLIRGADFRANFPVPLRRLPVYHLPVMLAQHLHGVVGSSEPTANPTDCRASACWRSRVGAGPGDRASFEAISEGFKKDELLHPGTL
jgi:hypothetical protein